MTNADRIRNETDDEELLYMIGSDCRRCAYAEGYNGDACGCRCFDGNLEWMKQEVEDDDER